MQSQYMRYFLAVYEHLNLTVAAEAVHVSQPALSRSLKRLEDQFGVPLFVRHPRGLEATRFADILARHAQRMDMEYRHALAEIEIANGGSEAMLKIGAGPIWYSQILPDVFSSYLQRHPSARIRVQSGVISTLVPQLLAGQVDLICSTLDFPAQAGLIREPLLKVEHVVVVHKDHPLARGTDDILEPSDLAGFSWIVLADDQVGSSRILSYFAAHDLALPVFSIETSSPTHMFEMLRRGTSLAQIPTLLLPTAERFDLVQLPLRGNFWAANAGICYRSTDTLSPRLTGLIKSIRSFLSQDQT